MPEWDAEVEVDASSTRLLGEGWDNSVWVVEDQWAFRFPRREVAVPLVARELAVLGLLAALVPVPVPAPWFVGEPSERFAWPFFGARLLGGLEVAEAALIDAERDALGAPLGTFLGVLHAPGTLAAVDPDGRLPVDPNR